jgi:hypothetical protein
LVLRRITCGFGVFRKIRRYFLRIFLRFLSPGRISCGSGAFRKSAGIPEEFPADFVFYF